MSQLHCQMSRFKAGLPLIRFNLLCMHTRFFGVGRRIVWMQLILSDIGVAEVVPLFGPFMKYTEQEAKAP